MYYLDPVFKFKTMRLLHTEITPFIKNFLHVDLRQQPFLASPFHAKPAFHAHPELELTYILKGYGKRIIGNKVEPFKAGDMVFIGSNVPHVWLSDPVFYEENSMLESQVIVTYFNPAIFQHFCSTVREFDDINRMIYEASKGIQILGKTHEIIAKKLLALSSKNGFEKVNELLQIMHLISVSLDINFINKGVVSEEEPVHSDRIVDVIRYAKEHLGRSISLKEVADISCMTEQSFCRFFKKRTQKTFFQYLNDLRIDQAKQLLRESDRSISDIAYLCGFSSSSHFCKVFKEYTEESPLQYRSILAPWD